MKPAPTAPRKSGERKIPIGKNAPARRCSTITKAASSASAAEQADEGLRAGEAPDGVAGADQEEDHAEGQQRLAGEVAALGLDALLHREDSQRRGDRQRADRGDQQERERQSRPQGCPPRKLSTIIVTHPTAEDSDGPGERGGRVTGTRYAKAAAKTAHRAPPGTRRGRGEDAGPERGRHEQVAGDGHDERGARSRRRPRRSASRPVRSRSRRARASRSRGERVDAGAHRQPREALTRALVLMIGSAAWMPANSPISGIAKARASAPRRRRPGCGNWALRLVSTRVRGGSSSGMRRMAGSGMNTMPVRLRRGLRDVDLRRGSGGRSCERNHAF